MDAFQLTLTFFFSALVLAGVMPEDKTLMRTLKPIPKNIDMKLFWITCHIL